MLQQCSSTYCQRRARQAMYHSFYSLNNKTNQGSFSEEDRTKLTLIYENVASRRDEMKELREELEGSKLEIKQLKTENNQ